MINLDDWAEIRHLFSTGKHSKREIGRIVGVSRGTVDRALESDRAPKYQRASGVSSSDDFAPRVRELLVKTPTMPAATLAERVGWSGSGSLFRAKVAAIRPEYAAPDPADRLVHEPGFQVQCDLSFPMSRCRLVRAGVIRRGAGEDVGVLRFHPGADVALR